MKAIALFCCLVFAANTQAAGKPRPLIKEGKEFLLVFNHDHSTLDSADLRSYKPTLEIYFVAGKDSTDITVTCGAFSSYMRTFHLRGESVLHYRITDDIDPMLYSSGIIESKAVKVSSSSPIQCFTFFTWGLLGVYDDGYETIPVEQLGSHYFVMSYSTCYAPGDTTSYLDYTPGEFSVAAVNNETSVTIKLSSATIAGDDYKKELHYTLNAGECLQFKSKLSAHFDLTGTEIVSSAPVVVYGSHGEIGIPFYTGYRPGYHEICPPVESWGQAFVVRKFPPREGSYMEPFHVIEDSVYDVVRVLASEDSTVAYINGKEWGNPFGKGEFRDTICAYPLLIETSAPSLVAQYAHEEYGSESDTAGWGNLTMVPPLEGSFNSYRLFLHPYDSIQVYDWTDLSLRGFTHEYVMIATDKEGRGHIRIDGELMQDSGFIDLSPTKDGKEYSIGSYRLRGGVHSVSSDLSSSQGFTAIAFGFGAEKGFSYDIGRRLPSSEAVSSAKSNTTGQIKIINSNDDQLRILLSGAPYGNSLLFVYDILGRKIHEESFRLNEGEEFSITIPVRSWSGGVYYVSVVTSTGEVRTLKFMK
jgi:hypothetical protein